MPTRKRIAEIGRLARPEADDEQARDAEALERAIRDGWQLEHRDEFWGTYVFRRNAGDYLRLDADRLARLYRE